MRKSLDKRNDYRCKFTKNNIIGTKKGIKKQVDFHFVLLHRSIVEQIPMYQPANRLIHRIDLQYELLLSREVYSLASLYRIKNL